MSRKHYLLDLFNGVEDHFILEAMEEPKAVRVLPRKRRLVLIAAVLALALLLMGCVAVFLGLRQRNIGELPVTEKFDVYGHTVPQPEKTYHIASMSGFNNSPAQQASREWNEFQRTYDPGELTNTMDDPAIPNRFEYTYSCWDQTMVDKVTQIAETYDVQLLGTWAVAQAWQREAAFEILGLGDLVLDSAPAEAAYGACRIYPPYNFVSDIRLTLTGEKAPWTEEAFCEVYYLRSGYLAPNDAFYYDPETTREWEYTTADGTQVLLALSGVKGLILAQQEEATVVIQLDMAWRQGPYLDEGTPLPTQAALEAMADCFDYQITPKAAPMEGLQETFDAMENPDNLPPEDFEDPKYASYAAYLLESCLWPEQVQYAFHDIDGDGQEDLITSFGDGFSIDWLTIRDGQVTGLNAGRGPLRLCEGGIVEFKDPTMEQHIYYKILGPDPEAGVILEPDHSVMYGSGQWKIDSEIRTAQEAADFMARYAPLKLDWKPMTGFPMDDSGTTFADVIAREGTLSGEALLKFYGENAPENCAADYPWFTLRDINSDGIEDLLLSSDGEFIDWIFTCKRGKLVELGGSCYLLEGDLMHQWDQVDRYNVGVLQRNSFTQFTGGKVSFYYRLTHNLSTDVWEDNSYTQVPGEEARAFLEAHPRMRLTMRPIEELTGK